MNTGTMPSQAILTARYLMEELKKYGFENPRVFQIQNSQPEVIKHALHLANISHVETKNKHVVLVEQADYLRCCQIEKQEINKQCSFVQEYSDGELESIIKNHPAITNKQMLLIENLSQAEVEQFVQKCNAIKPGLLLETNRQPNGTVSVSIPQMLLSANERTRVVSAYLQAVCDVTSGSNSALLTERDFTQKNYFEKIKKEQFVKIISFITSEKLSAAGITAASFNDYFTAMKRHVAYVLDSLKNDQPMVGFTDAQQRALQKAYGEVPKNSFDYTANFLNKHDVSARDAMEPEKDKPVQTKINEQERI